MILAADLESTESYLENFSISNNAHFCFGSIEDVMTDSIGNPDWKYPVIWAELPKIQTQKNEVGNLMEAYKYEVTAFYSGNTDDKISRLAAYKNSLALLYKFQKKLEEDASNGSLICELSGMIKEPLLTSIFNDSHYGYILSFEASFHANSLIR
jgi:hypothetical protein